MYWKTAGHSLTPCISLVSSVFIFVGVFGVHLVKLGCFQAPWLGALNTGRKVSSVLGDIRAPFRVSITWILVTDNRMVTSNYCNGWCAVNRFWFMLACKIQVGGPVSSPVTYAKCFGCHLKISQMTFCKNFMYKIALFWACVNK